MTEETIRLAPLTELDLEPMFAWINDSALVSKNGYYQPISDLSHGAWFERIRTDSSVKIFGIRQESDDKLIGSCQLHSIDIISRSAELQVRIGDGAGRGRGFGTQALKKLLEFGFDDLNLNRIYLYVFVGNDPAISLYRKIGFQVEGTLRQAAFISGQYTDVLVMGILADEFRTSGSGE